MDTFSGLPDARQAYVLRCAQTEAVTLARHVQCEACGEERLCARLEPLAFEERWLCLSSCWTYQLGLLHGRRSATRELRSLVDEFARSLR